MKDISNLDSLLILIVILLVLAAIFVALHVWHNIRANGRSTDLEKEFREMAIKVIGLEKDVQALEGDMEAVLRRIMRKPKSKKT